MKVREADKGGHVAAAELGVDTFTDGMLDPALPMLGPVASGSRIVATTAPGCWGPMITPSIKGGHEVTRPVAVEGARVGDAIAIRIQAIEIHSLATASGKDQQMPGRNLGDPYVVPCCPSCGTVRPATHLEGIGPTAVRCNTCGADATPFTFLNGYTIVFDDEHTLGVTVGQASAERIATQARRYARVPENSQQNPVLALAPHDLVGLMARVRPFLGQLGTTPAVRMPDSHNAGDFGASLLGAGHEYALTEAELELRTDGHMDIDAAGPGAIVVCPVKVEGAGVYAGDMHALQGDGEIAGHTCDVAGVVTLDVDLLPGVTLEGPVLFPRVDDLPVLARPFSSAERDRAAAIARHWDVEIEETAPISVVGTGADLNLATENGLERASRLLGMSVPEVRNRATITGAIEIGRLPGVVQVSFLAPLAKLDDAGLLELAQQQYGE